MPAATGDELVFFRACVFALGLAFTACAPVAGFAAGFSNDAVDLAQDDDEACAPKGLIQDIVVSARGVENKMETRVEAVVARSLALLHINTPFVANAQSTAKVEPWGRLDVDLIPDMEQRFSADADGLDLFRHESDCKSGPGLGVVGEAISRCSATAYHLHRKLHQIARTTFAKLAPPRITLMRLHWGPSGVASE